MKKYKTISDDLTMMKDRLKANIFLKEKKLFLKEKIK
jgi:hypothetical protein